MKGTFQLVKSSVNVTQMTSASLTSWNENISKRWILKQKILSWSWNTSVYSDGRPVSLVGLQQMIGGRLSILIVGVAREVVVLLSFRFDLSRSLRLPNVPNGATNKATKGFMDGCSNIWLHYRHSWTHLRPESTLNRPQSRTKRSLDTKNGQFTHLLIFFLCVRAMSLEDAWKRTSKVTMGSTNGIGRYNATFMSCLPNFGVKRLHADVWSSFTVRNFSMIIDMYTSFSSDIDSSEVE